MLAQESILRTNPRKHIFDGKFLFVISKHMIVEM